ncbi:MAG: hypothetical protein LEGION0398_MBIBDBAK_01140 [Legionellaceae bacterium]
MFATPPTIQSSIDNERIITQSQWCLSLLRRKKSGNPRHAYIVLEGITPKGIGLIHRYDFVINENNDSFGIVKAERYRNIPLNDMLSGLKEVVRFDNNNDELYFKSWMVNPSLANPLDENIKNQEKLSFPYNALGKTSYSTSNEGHNCFTWAREELHKLKQSDIQVEEKWTDNIVANPALYLPKEGTSAKCNVM